MTTRIRSQAPPAGRQAILDAIATPVFAVDLAKCYTAFNEAHAAVMKRAYGAEIEIGCDALAYPAIPLDGELVRDSLDSALNGETVLSKAWVGPAADRRFYWTTHSPIIEGDEIVGVAMVSLDLTENEQAHEAIARLGAVVESSDDAIITASLEGEILTWNHGAERMYGYSAQEAIGQPLSVFVAPDEPERIRKLLKGTGHGDAAEHFESNRLRKDGRRVDVSVGVTPLCSSDGIIIGAASIAHDITHRKLAEEAIARNARALRAISRVNEALVRATLVDELLSTVCEVIVTEGGYAVAWVGYGLHDSARSIVSMASCGDDSGYVDALHLSWAEGPQDSPAGRVLREGTEVVVQDAASEPGWDLWREATVSHGIRSNISLPITGPDGSAFGALCIYSHEPNSFSPDEIALLREMSGDLSYGIQTLTAREQRQQIDQDLLATNRRLETIVREVTETMGHVVEARDPYTQGHQVRVATICKLLAKEMGLPDSDIEGIAVAALVHDIGKLAVPSEILTKPGKLSETEFALIKEHPQTGFEILGHIDFGWPVAEIALEHHERMDGTGYPNGMVGDEILPAARIMAVADVIEAMASHRPYRAALGLDAAVAEVVGHPEKFDSQVIAACVRLHEAGTLLF
jgi:PAS domain S-box-containing protein/putative nucleotidyltransferase with HDIG domain